jgi:hypothetical protein
MAYAIRVCKLHNRRLFRGALPYEAKIIIERCLGDSASLGELRLVQSQRIHRRLNTAGDGLASPTGEVGTIIGH